MCSKHKKMIMMNRNINTCQNDTMRHKSPVKSNSPNSIGIYSNYSVKQTSSGSETDISTSTENLSPEEHYVLKTSTRQEPQGEETYFGNDCLSSLNNTLIIHGNEALDNSIYSYIAPHFLSQQRNMLNENLNKNRDDDSFAYHNHVIRDQHNSLNNNNNNNNDKNEVVQMKNNLVSLIDNDSPYSNLNLLKYSNQPTSMVNNGSQVFIKNDSVIKFCSSNDQTKMNNTNNNNGTNSAIDLQQPMLNNYLNSLKKNDSLMFRNFNVNNMDLPPPPNYEKPWNALQHGLNANSKSIERFSISRSHPDLSKFSDDDSPNGNQSSILAIPFNSGLFNLNPAKRNNTIEILLVENSQLRTELDFCYKKIQKYEKVESEIQKIHQLYDELMKSSERKEKFERDARYKLEIEVKKLQKQNKCLQERLEHPDSNQKNSYDETEFEKELNKRGALITYLLTKNKELMNFKERQEIELEAQRLTLQEQRNHIEILDTALINAQNNIMTLENELRSKQGWEEKTLFLEKALSNLQSTNERRLQMEKRIRTYLEKELEKLKNPNSETSNSDSSIVNNKNNDDVETLRSTVVDYEKKIIDLEAEVSKWEQKYLEENTLRSIEISAASAPKDAKIAALERTSQESEKLIAEARIERLKHMDEIHGANKRCTELESKLKDLSFKLAEKETIINVLQKHSDDRDAVLQKTLGFTNARHCKSASTMGLIAANTNTNTAAQNPSTEYQLMLANANLRANNNIMVNDTVENSATGLDKQLKDIDSQLSSKDSIINALRSEKERYPNHYNNWRL